MTKELNAKDVPQIAWEYWGLVSFCLDNPGLYGMDKRRSDCHERLCKYYNISKRKCRQITDHLNKYENAVQMHEVLKKIAEANRAQRLTGERQLWKFIIG